MLASLLLSFAVAASAGQPQAFAELASLLGGLAIPVGTPQPKPVRVGDEAGSLVVRLFDGRRLPLTLPGKVLLRVIDGAQRTVLERHVSGPVVAVDGLPLWENGRDRYRVIASAPGWRQAGIVLPKPLRAGSPPTLDIMLLPAAGRLDFSRTRWEGLPLLAPVAGLLTDRAALDRYERLMRERPEFAASLLNATAAAAMLSIGGRTLLSYYKELVWDDMSRAYFFAYADAGLIELLRADKRRFRRERWPGLFHPGATISFKQTEFSESNLQLTFNENDRRGGLVRLETDMDLYRDQFAHFFLEVAPVLGKRGKTDPRTVFQWRWMAARLEGASEFDPLYDVVAE